MTTLVRTEKTIDKSTWGDGPWQQEPDRREWLYLGFPCLILRNHHSTGALNGYVAVPKHHPWHGKEYDNIEADVHGGLTYSGDSKDPRWDWVPLPDTTAGDGFVAAIQADRDDRLARNAYADWLRDHNRGDEADLLLAAPSWWWVGFDCAHAGDLCPAMDARLGTHFQDLHTLRNDIYRDMKYVIVEVEALAAQADKATD